MNLVPILDSTGKVVYCDNDTGKVIEDYNRDVETKIFQPFCKKKAEAFATLIAQGRAQSEVMEILGLNRSTITNWKMNNPDFSNLIELARANRADQIHETEYENSIKYIAETDPLSLDEEELETFKKHLSLIQQRSKLLSDFKKQDSPNKFGTKKDAINNNINLNSLTFNAELSPEVEKLVRQNFTPVVNAEGSIGLDETDDERLEQIRKL